MQGYRLYTEVLKIKYKAFYIHILYCFWFPRYIINIEELMFHISLSTSNHSAKCTYLKDIILMKSFMPLKINMSEQLKSSDCNQTK